MPPQQRELSITLRSSDTPKPITDPNDPNWGLVLDPNDPNWGTRINTPAQTPTPPTPRSVPGQLWDWTGRMGGQVVRNTVEPVRAGVGALWEATKDPVDAAERAAQFAKQLFSGIGAAQGEQFTKAEEAAAKGDYASAVLHGGAYLLPIVGPMLDDMQARVRAGQSAEVAGDLFTMFVLPQLAKQVPNVRTPRLNALGPKETAATQWALNQNPPVPLSVGEATGNVVARTAEYIAERGTVAGSVMGPRGVNKMSEGFNTIGAQLRDKVNNGRGPRTSLQAGEAIVAAMGPEGRVVRTLRSEADALYKQATALTGREAAYAVDLKTAQLKLRDLYKQLAASPEKLPLRGDLHQAAMTLDEVMKLDNTVPFMVAETGVLSPLKTVQRGFAKNSREWNVIQEAIDAVDEQVMAGARAGGQGVEDMIKQARLKTAQMHEVMDFKMEPTSVARLGKQVVAPGDTGIETTRRIQQYAPEVLPDVGRAAIDELFAPSLVKDGITKVDSLLNRWMAIGDETKRAYFADAIKRDPNFLSDMDNLTLALSRLSNKINASNSTGTAAGVAHGVNAVWAQNPALSVLFEAYGGVIPVVMRNPKVVRLLTRGLQLPTNAVAARAANVAAIYKALELGTAPARAQGAGPNTGAGGGR